MKILHVVRQYAPAVGGLESYVKSMVVRQQAKGHDCEVLTLNRIFHGVDKILPAQEMVDGISVRRVPFVGFRRFFLPLVSPKYFGRFDIIHVHNTDVFFDYVALISPFIKAPIFATTHGGFFHTKNFSLIKKIYFNVVTRFTASRYHSLFAISQNDFNNFNGLNKNILLQPNAVELMGNFITTGQDFVYLGRLAKHKNVHQLLQTHAALKHQHETGASLHIIGPEWDVSLTELSDLASRLGILDSVKFHGCMDPAQMPEILKQCGYFVSASSYEGFGMSMLEAMSVGLIPFVYPNEAFKELIGLGGVGACVRFDRPLEASQEIRKKIPAFEPSDRVRARDFAALYSWDKLVEGSLDAYAGALK